MKVINCPTVPLKEMGQWDNRILFKYQENSEVYCNKTGKNRKK